MVRDYVQGLLSAGERADIVDAGLSRYFGPDWREGKIKLRRVSPEYREFLSSGPGNEFALLHHYISQGLASGERDVNTVRGAFLGVYYLNHLMALDRYRDCVLVAWGLLQIISREGTPDQWLSIALIYGKSLRMTGERVTALTYLRESAELAKGPERASAWLNVALAEESLGNKPAARIAVEECLNASREGSVNHLHGLAIRAGLLLEGEAKRRALLKLSRQAKEKNFAHLAGVISYKLHTLSSSPAAKIKHLDEILIKKDTGYTRARALVAKAGVLTTHPELGKLTAEELSLLSSTYSYAHAQRLGYLFDSSHDRLWDYFAKQRDVVVHGSSRPLIGLISLLRHAASCATT